MVNEMDAETVLYWEKLLKDAGLRVTAVSEEIGSRSYLPGLFSAARKNPEKVPDPSVTVVQKLGAVLGLTLDEMMRVKSHVTLGPSPSYQSEIGRYADRIFTDLSREIRRRQNISLNRPSVEDVLNWWRENNGRLEAADRIQEAFDLIEIPDADAKKITAAHVGGKSLAALKLGAEKERLARVLDLLPEDESLDMVVSYRAAARSPGPRFSTPLKMVVKSSADDIDLEEEYIRMQLPVTTPANVKLILSYCF